MSHFSRSRPLFVGLILGAGAVFALRAHSDVDSSLQLATYRAALSQLSAGKPENARMLLEGSRKNAVLADESALLLAFLQDQNGQSNRARATLYDLQTPSPLVLAYRARLGDAIEISPKSPKNVRPDNAARLNPSDARISKLEREMVGLVNAQRAKNGLRALVWDDDLAAVSRAHSAEMRDKKYFSHDSPTPELKEPLDRYRLGYGETPQLVAENIYRIWGSRSFLTANDVADAHAALMKSPGHRANILLPNATFIGIGIATDATGNLWLTQMFSKPF